ncbi:MAG TPA: hypothetical protein VGM64_04280 [Lacunisphaera sp.]|jgi:hypothetical protein
MTTPVIFLVFNRPALTRQVFARIRDARPPQLYVVADGPRPDRPGEAEKCAEVRRLIEEGIDWPCELIRDYSDVNLGCGKRVASGITNVFKRVEEAIILEDDCLPDPTFFPFCSELLEKYRNEPQVGLISGSHHQSEFSFGRDDYYFCRYGNIWGWATWKRAWQCFDYSMNDWSSWIREGKMNQLFAASEVREYWTKIWDDTAAGKYDTWDYQWTFCYMSRGMLGILPRTALIENIGFGPDATHTLQKEDSGSIVGPMIFPLRHPLHLKPDFEAEARASQRFFSEPSTMERIRRKAIRIYQDPVREFRRTFRIETQ